MIHNHQDLNTIEERPLMENMRLSPKESMSKAFQLMSPTLMFSKNKAIKSQQRLGIILKK